MEPVEARAAVTRGKAKAQEPHGAAVELDPQRGEGGRQARLPQSFLLSEVVRTPVMVPTLAVDVVLTSVNSQNNLDSVTGAQKKREGQDNLHPDTEGRPFGAAVAAANTNLGSAKALCEVPLFSATQMQTVGFEVAEVFKLAASFCANAVEGQLDQNSTTPSCEKAGKDLPDEKEPTWHAAAARLVNLSARPAIERTLIRPNVILLDNRNKVLRMVGPAGKEYFLERVMLDSGAQPLMLGRSVFHGLGMKKSDLDKCPFQIQTSVGAGSTEWLTRNPLRLTFLPGHQFDETTTRVPAVVTGAESYNVLVGSAVLYPLGFVLDYWGESVCFRPGWQSGEARTTELPSSFFVSSKDRRKGGLSSLATFAALSDFTWPRDLAADIPEVDIPLVEEQPAMASMKLGAGAASYRHTHGWGECALDPAEFQRAADKHVKEAWKKAFAPMAGTSAEDQSGANIILHAPLNTTPISWKYPEQGVTVLDLFGGISTGLAVVLQAGIRVHQYLYVEKDEASRRASLRHVASLVYRYPDLLPNTAVRAYQHQLPADISLLGAQDLTRVGEINLVIAGWPCQGHSTAGGLIWLRLRY